MLFTTLLTSVALASALPPTGVCKDIKPGKKCTTTDPKLMVNTWVPAYSTITDSTCICSRSRFSVIGPKQLLIEGTCLSPKNELKLKNPKEVDILSNSELGYTITAEQIEDAAKVGLEREGGVTIVQLLQAWETTAVVKGTKVRRYSQVLYANPITGAPPIITLLSETETVSPELLLEAQNTIYSYGILSPKAKLVQVKHVGQCPFPK